MHFNVWNDWPHLHVCENNLTADYCQGLPSWFKVHWHEVSYEFLHIKWTELCTIICWDCNCSQKANTHAKTTELIMTEKQLMCEQKRSYYNNTTQGYNRLQQCGFLWRKNKTCLTLKWFSKRVIIKSIFPNSCLIYLDVIHFSNQMVIKEENKPIYVKWWNFNSVLWL